MESTEMARRAICRVWYGKRSGLPQSFKDIGNFNAAANFATFIVADRIEVVRQPLTPAVAVAGKDDGDRRTTGITIRSNRSTRREHVGDYPNHAMASQILDGGGSNPPLWRTSDICLGAKPQRQNHRQREGKDGNSPQHETSHS
jgi:hypothetical protein